MSAHPAAVAPCSVQAHSRHDAGGEHRSGPLEFQVGLYGICSTARCFVDSALRNAAMRSCSQSYRSPASVLSVQRQMAFPARYAL